jgi:general secretion pathway protein H
MNTDKHRFGRRRYPCSSVFICGSKGLSSGITLIEMLVVMTLLGLLATVATPSIGSGVETVRLRGSGERMASTMRLARERAMRSRHYMQVSVDPKSHIVELRDLEMDSASSWEIPDTIRIKTDDPVAFLFYPDGGAQAAQLTLENSRGRQVLVAMDPFTLFPRVTETSK